MSTWIKRSEREPTKADLPIIIGAYMPHVGWDIGLYDILPCPDHWSTHWRSVKCDPPARELTQRERDIKMVERIWDRGPNGAGVIYIQDKMLEAIYAERREVAKLMALYAGEFWGTHDYSSSELMALRRRLDEQGGGK